MHQYNLFIANDQQRIARGKKKLFKKKKKSTGIINETEQIYNAHCSVFQA